MNEYSSLKLDNQLCFSLYALSREIIKLYKPLLDELNLTYTQYIVMLVLWEEDKASVKHIGNRLHLDSGTLTPLLKKLEAMGLVKRYRDQSDDRVVIAELTEKGSSLKEKAKNIPNKVLCNIKLPVEKAVELKNSLDELLDNLE
ncbi:MULTISPECIES: MarR family transcriptional regulator [unclassified Clostridium]|uniref:MarR family winged helix-turn-helix transcriptional regulator n=1 Tax=unclassified Clostridium TaxID=2614128 RepID=UPI0029150031|nr:MarR family transcriptional regulator [Clostridium sp.]MDU5107862.1 MarR family transcriptional regulator [Clostridium sp.]